MGNLSPETRALLQHCSTANILTALWGRGFRGNFLVGLKAVDPEVPRMVGEAYTLRLIPSREDKDGFGPYGSHGATMLRAIEECPEGSVLVIDARGEIRAGSAGDIFIHRLKVRGAAGIVSDGGFRDVEGIAQWAFPAFHRQPAPTASATVHCAGELNVPIGCAGVAVYPGDIVVGDRDGVVILPAALADKVAEEVTAKTNYEEYVDHEVGRGQSLLGLYPPTEEARLKYKAWKAGSS